MFAHEYYAHGIMGFGDLTNDHHKAYEHTAYFLNENNFNVTQCFADSFRNGYEHYLQTQYYSKNNHPANVVNKALSQRVQTIMSLINIR